MANFFSDRRHSAGRLAFRPSGTDVNNAAA
jgi:hypothetical protein